MGKSSKDRRDIFYRMAKEQGWRARSAFKLLQADETFNLIDGVTRAVDLCAAPGGWSQVLSKKMYEPKTPEEREKVKIIAVDMQGMAPIDGVTELRADITKESTAKAIIDFFGGQKAQLVVSDGAPDVTGNHDWDNYMQAQLLLSALSISTYILEEGGSFMGKVYRAANTSDVYRQLKRFFKDACVFKPSASRNSSIEAFVVCRQFCMPKGHVPCNLITEWYDQPDLWLRDITHEEPGPVEHLPFVAHECDLDADLSYELDETYEHLEAVQKPLTAAYQEVVEKTKNMSVKYKSYIIYHDNDPRPQQETEMKYEDDEKQAGDEKQSSDEKQEGDEKQAGDEKQEGDVKQASDEKQEGDAKQASDESQSSDEKPAGDEKQASGEKQASDEKLTGDAKPKEDVKDQVD